MALSRRQFIAGSAALLQKRRTNLVMFMTDDHGPWATGMSGCAEMATPNVDRLAREGVRFTNAHACTPVSSPSRMTWLTGLLPCQHGVQDYLLPEDSFGPSSRQWLKGLPTWSEMLQGAGYRLAMTGKWHMGMDDTAQAGFTFWASVPGGGGPYKDATFVKKLALRAGGQGNELYDLKTDPGESKNIYRQDTALERDLNQFFHGAGAPPLEDWRTTTKQKLIVYTAPV